MRSTFYSTLPGVNPHDAHSLVRDVCQLPGLGQLPDRGPGADAVGRMLGLISHYTGEFSGETTATGWRITSGRGRAMRRADQFMASDLDEVHEIFDSYAESFKWAALGPVSLAAHLELPNGEKVLADSGACRDLIAAYTATIASVNADLQRRLVQAHLILQLDEPLLNEVINGAIPSQSGYRRYAPIPEIELRDLLSPLLTLNRPLLNIGSAVEQLATFTPAEVSGYFLELDAVKEQHFDAIGSGFDSGLRYVFGLPNQQVSQSVQQLSNLANRIGFALSAWTEGIDCYPTPTEQSADLSALRARIERLNQVVSAMGQEVE